MAANSGLGASPLRPPSAAQHTGQGGTEGAALAGDAPQTDTALHGATPPPHSTPPHGTADEAPASGGTGGDDDDMDLSKAIGDIFGQFDFTQMAEQHAPQEAVLHTDNLQPLEQHAEAGLPSRSGVPSPAAADATGADAEGAAAGVDAEGEAAVDAADDASNHDLDLEAAIGNAFQMLSGAGASDAAPGEVVPGTAAEPGGEPGGEPVAGAASECGTEPAAAGASSSSDSDDLDLEGAIGNAFRSIAVPPHSPLGSQADHDLDMENAISEAFKSATAEPKTPSLEGVVHNLVHQLADTDSGAIPDDVLQELAAEITNQVQDNAPKKAPLQVTDMPHIDENVLAHFQEVAHGDESSKDGLQAALATVVRNAIESSAAMPRRGSVAPGAGAEADEEADLDLLRINDILQNAFTMAMENPQDLLQNLGIEDEALDARVSGAPQAVASALAKLLHPLPSSTTSFLESLNRSQDIELGGKRAAAASGGTSAQEPPKKLLSIAETLALHRSSMAGRRDYASIATMDEALRNEYRRTGYHTTGPAAAPGPFGGALGAIGSTQLSNALSSLSLHINSGNTETNLLQVIRQMTNSLSSSKGYLFLDAGATASLSAAVPSADEVIAGYRDKGEAGLQGLLRPLRAAREFLARSDDTLAVKVIDEVVAKFGGTDAAASDAAIKDDAIASIRESVMSSVTSFTNSRSWRISSLLGEKPKSDTPEYKERIRLENRERKKRWREENAERNKDNDLRSRVLKRAANMFGDGESASKKAWVDEEFNRRREKRIAKQKKEDQEKAKAGGFYEGEGPPSPGGASAVKAEDNPLARDDRLVRSVTDTFNIFSGARADAAAALAATSAATAAVAAAYALEHNLSSYQQVSLAVSAILSSLMDNAVQRERLLSLSRGVVSLKGRAPSAAEPAGILSRILSTLRGFTASDADLRSGDKRERPEPLEGDAKRRATSPAKEPAWSATSLKMPQYRKPVGGAAGSNGATHDQGGAEPTDRLERASPFISNKITPGAGLRKPGTFQRPVFSKPNSARPRGAGMGFPTLYSASFKLN